jgi:hypothetical protein
VATAVYAEFVEMLNEAPQYSGNYVAHMRIGTSRKGGTSRIGMFTIPKSVTEAYHRGNMPAISIALENSENFITNYAANLLGKGGWLPTITVSNDLRYAEFVEAMDSLRTENAGGEHAVDKLRARIDNIKTVVTMKDFYDTV